MYSARLLPDIPHSHALFPWLHLFLFAFFILFTSDRTRTRFCGSYKMRKDVFWILVWSTVVFHYSYYNDISRSGTVLRLCVQMRPKCLCLTLFLILSFSLMHFSGMIDNLHLYCQTICYMHK